MSEHFRPYEGSAPFLFVSYAHVDSAQVVPAIRVLHDRWWRVWYDEGIPAGSDWSLNIGRHMDSCAAVLLFLSAPAMASPHCTSEARTAARLGKPVICVRLDDAEPHGEWCDFLEGAHFEGRATDPRDQADAITACTVLTDDFLGTAEEYRRAEHARERRSPWAVLVALAALLLVGSLLALGAVLTGRVAPQDAREQAPEEAEPPTPVVDLSQYGDLFASYASFPDAQQERAIRAALGVRTGQVPAERLPEVTELCFCGRLTPSGLDAVSFDADGTCLVNGVPAGEGQVSELSLIGSLPCLERLALVAQPVEELSALAGLTQLRELSLAASPVSDLSPLVGLPSLTTLHLEHSAVRDLSPLASLPALTRVTVSADLLPLDIDPSATYDVVLVR